jgi:hypothetical protein
MCRNILIGLVVFFVLLMATAALIVQTYGWPGFLVFVAALVVLGFVGWWLLPQLFGFLLTRPMRQMGAVLKGARIVVHSVTPCDPPPEMEWNADEDDEPPRITDRPRDQDDPDADDDGDDGDDEPIRPLDWYRLEFSVIPTDAGPTEGRMVTRRSWMPAMIGAAGVTPPLSRSNPLRGWPPPEQFTDNVQHADVEIWNGDEFETPGDEVFGEQRLQMRVGVTPDVDVVTITYVQFNNLGEVRLPRIDARPGQET